MGIISKHLKGLAGNVVGGMIGSLLNGGFNPKTAGTVSALSLGRNQAKIREQSQEVFEENEYSFGTVQYPLDLATNLHNSNGHYMIFYINIPSEDLSESEIAMNDQQTTLLKPDLGSKVVQLPRRERINSTMKGRTTFERIQSAIVLYMPPEVGVTYGADYAGEDIGSVARNIDNLDDFNFSQEFTSFVRQNVVGAADALAPGMVAMRQAATGVAVNNRLELTFKAINLREFSYSFKFMPRNKKEADEVQKIIYMFKYHMHPTVIGGSNTPVFRVPSQFNIHYMYRGDENKYLNTMGESVLANMEVKYGEGDQFKTYRGNEGGAPPSVINMNLTFRELDIQDKKSIFKHELPPDRAGSGNMADRPIESVWTPGAK
tara:strand:- start:4022 stop:5146 length:1125 start_codon:yes stop_codon:yes gene_type:complete